SRIGAMHESIVERVLQHSPRLLEQWHQVAARQDAHLADLVREGSLDAVVEPAALPGEIDRFLTYCALSRSGAGTRLRHRA
ncbi:MAG: hypothetical protein ACM368_10030, partial [Gemmatimonadota bacterium]